MERINRLIKKTLENANSTKKAILIHSKVNRFYFSNFTSSLGYIFAVENTAYLLVDFRYYEAAKQKVKGFNIILFEKLEETLIDLAKKYNINQILLEYAEINLSFACKLKNLFKKESIKIKFSSELENSINQMRSIKEKNEIENIKIAQSITEKAFNFILGKIKVGKTEKDLALELEYFMKKHGAQDLAFELIVLSGENTNMPHGVPSDKKIEYGDVLTVDIGAKFNGYNSDMTRNVFVGKIKEEYKKIYKILLNAQTSAIKAIKPGITFNQIDKIARDLIRQNGFGKYFGHALGHSLGLQIHENPGVNKNNNTKIKSGMVFTIEPGIYLPGKFGMRIEDMILVTENGYENLTGTTKNFIII